MASSPLASPTVRTFSPLTSSVTLGQQQKINIVTRVALEGKAKKGKDGASIRLYLKMALPLDSVIPGSTIPLFPEENVKILSAEVHPLDANSVPYAFSSTASPLLHNACRALGLPARSSRTYMSLFNETLYSSDLPSLSTLHRRSSSSPTMVDIPPVEERYAGQILVGGYNVSYVLPKEFPPGSRIGRMSPDIHDSTRSSPLAYKGRRMSAAERNIAQFIAALDLWVPYLTKPPRCPYLLSIPTPRCLSNQIKLRIFPPKNSNTSSSLHSLSSAEEEPGSWELASDPHVTRSASSHPSRNKPYTEFADDESSDSSTAGFSDGYGLQGTFPSTERIRVRWAPPMKALEGDGRRRVGVREAKGETTCVVLGKAGMGKGKDKARAGDDENGVVMRVEYSGTCKGVWYPGVATLLGLDVSLDAQGSEVAWAPGAEVRWIVNGGAGFTGYDVSPTSPSVPLPDRRSLSKEDSLEGAPNITVVPASPDKRAAASSMHAFRQQSSTSNATASLMRGPLPSTGSMSDYSFEANPLATSSPTGSGTLFSMASQSGVSSLPASELTPSEYPDILPPNMPITLHLNINELLLPAKNVFTFTISGTILVKPRFSPLQLASSAGSSASFSVSELDSDPLSLPRFRVFAADSEAISTVVRSEIDDAYVDVYNATGDVRDAHTRRGSLHRGAAVRCGSDGGRIALRRPNPFLSVDRNPFQSSGSPRTPVRDHRSPTPPWSESPQSIMMTPRPRPRRDGRLMIPHVSVTVTPLTIGDEILPNGYAVRVCLPSPADADSEWLEFGLTQPAISTSKSDDPDAKSNDSGPPPRIQVASASVEGVPVRYEVSLASRQDPSDSFSSLGGAFGTSGKKTEWVTWVQVHVGSVGGSDVEIVYVVQDKPGAEIIRGKSRKGKGKAKDRSHLDVFLPRFSLAVGRLEIEVESAAELEISSLQSNLAGRKFGGRGAHLQHYSMEELFTPRLSFDVFPPHAQDGPEPFWKSKMISRGLHIAKRALPIIVFAILMVYMTYLQVELGRMKSALGSRPAMAVTDLSTDESAGTIPVISTLSAPAQTVLPMQTADRSNHAQPAPTSIVSSAAVPVAAPSGTAESADQILTSVLSSISTIYPYRGHEPTGVALYRPWHFTWPVEIDWPVMARETGKAVRDTFGSMWQTLKKLLNYPLPPP